MTASHQDEPRFDRGMLLRGAAGVLAWGSLGAAGFGLKDALTETAPAPAVGPGVTLFRIRNDEDPRHVDLRHYDTVVIHDIYAPLVRKLRRAHPKLKVLLYKNGPGIPTPPPRGDWRLASSGVGYRFAEAHHPEWFLTDLAGARMSSPVWTYINWADIGSRSYQQTWLANVAASIRQAGAHGVMIDDVNTGRQQIDFQQAGVFAKQFPTYDSWTAAVDSFLHTVGPGLRRRGHIVLANVAAAAYDPPELLGRWAKLCSGVVREHFLRWSDGSLASTAEWNLQMAHLRAVVGAGRAPTTLTTGTHDDTATMQLVRASLLLAWAPHVGGSTAWESPGGDPYNPALSVSLGKPLGAAALQDGIWTRQFANGSVRVDPTAMTASISPS
jgi:putative glycosyl hydrolase-like family 15 (GHL15) protein